MMIDWRNMPEETVRIYLPISADFPWDKEPFQGEFGRLVADARAEVIAKHPEAEGKDVAIYLQVASPDPGMKKVAVIR